MKNRYLFIFLLTSFVYSDYFTQNVCSYKYRKRITFDYTKVSGSTDLTDFPALISIASDNDLRTVANSGDVENVNGYDILFTHDDGVTLLDHELCAYTPATGALQCWVKIPLLKTAQNTIIYMYYGNSAISSDPSKSATWSNGYVGVWHLDNSLLNETGIGGLNGTNNGSTNTGTAKINSARQFVRSSSQFVDITPYNANYNLNSNITVSAWLRLSSTNNDQKIAGNQNNSNGGWKFGVFTDNKIEFEIRTSGNSPFLSRSASGGTALAANNWYYVIGQYSDPGNFIKTYLNGALDRNLTTSATCGTSNGTMKIGREPFASSAFLDGTIDELRLSNVIRSAEWIATEYNNQNTPATFYNISAEPKLWLGTTSVNWNTGSNWSGGTVPTAGQDVIIKNDSPTRQPLLNVSPQVGNIYIYNGANLNLSTRTLSVAYDVLNCGTITGSTGVLALNATTNSIPNQSIGGTGTTNLTHLLINNTCGPNPEITLNCSVSISGSLILSSGIVNTSSANILALGNSAFSNAGSAQSFVSGPMSKSGTAAFVFPIGTGQQWRRLGISNVSASTNFRAEYLSAAYSNTGNITAPLNNISTVEHWQLDRLSGTGAARVTLYWENAGSSGISDCPDLTIARWNGSTWVEHLSTSVGGSNCSGAGTGTITTNANVTSFSPFTFGSKSGGATNPLPVELSSFSSECNTSGVMLKWTCLSERNNDYFTIERSNGFSDFEKLSTIKGAGTVTQRTNYVFNDYFPLKGISYYRLKQTDFNGTYKVFNSIVTNCEQSSDFEISIFPNPNNGQFKIQGSIAGQKILICNAIGEILLEVNPTSTEMEIVLPEKGIYFIRPEQQGRFKFNKIIVD